MWDFCFSFIGFILCFVLVLFVCLLGFVRLFVWVVSVGCGVIFGLHLDIFVCLFSGGGVCFYFYIPFSCSLVNT